MSVSFATSDQKRVVIIFALYGRKRFLGRTIGVVDVHAPIRAGLLRSFPV
jgi:hypothetical protein